MVAHTVMLMDHAITQLVINHHATAKVLNEILDRLDRQTIPTKVIEAYLKNKAAPTLKP